MKLFIDTSNKKLILATIDYSNNVIDFSMQDTDNNMAKITVNEIEKFLTKNNLSLNEINEYLFTIGPGSFTGVKVAINIIRTISLTNAINKYHIIDSFTLIENAVYENTVIPFGKSKYYHKKVKGNKVNVISKEELRSLSSVNNGYKNFTKELLQRKIKSKKSFKAINKLDKAKIKYLSAF